MNYKDFSRSPAVELRLLSIIGVLTQDKFPFKIDNSPIYNISDYDRHRMETYFFADSHPFPCNVSFVIHVDKKGETIIADDEIEDYRKKWGDVEGVECAEEVLLRALTAGEDIGYSVERVDGFELHGIEQPIIDNTGKTITFVGGYKTDYAGIQPDGWSIYAVCTVLGVSALAAENWTYCGILAEGLALMLRKDYKLASFLLYCALESFINQKLESRSDELRLSEKLKKLIAATFDGRDLAKHEIYTSTISHFDRLTRLRNDIAHGTKISPVSKLDARSHLLLVLTLIASVEAVHADFSSLAAALKEQNLLGSSTEFWATWKDEE